MIVCDNDSNSAKLRAGDDDFTQTASGVIEDDISGDGIGGLFNFGEGGDDQITANGSVGNNIIGDDIHTLPGGVGGDDDILVGQTGEVGGDVRGDSVGGLIAIGGDDTLTIEGSVEGSVYGDYLGALGASGGDDTIVVDGEVAGDVVGDGLLALGGLGGDDEIVINGQVGGDVDADGLYDLGDIGGDDHVTIGPLAEVGGLIKGGPGEDTLEFNAVYQDELDALDPAAGSVTVAGNTYTWVDFETLRGIVREILTGGAAAADAPFAVYFESPEVIAIENDDGTGIEFYTPYGKTMVLLFNDLTEIAPLESREVHSTTLPTWYYVVTNLGVDPNNSLYHRYQVSIYNAGTFIGQFSFSYF